MPLPPPSPPSTTEITRHLSTLRGHLVNTLTGLRYIEKQLIPLSSHPSHPTVVQEMTNAWSHYVDTNFLNELRRLTKQYPFSEELFRDAKERVRGGGYRSWNSWNMAWVMLRVMEEDNLIPHHAHRLASHPSMWGGAIPKPKHAVELANVLQREWEGAVEHLLRNYEVPPVYGMCDGGL
ncbi:hypothetical protein FPQ18DRAFT_391765 [Pyronema domesticum]|nr:hypothetical protein FPQ18DRAFT_391765 [Pyronema domesticum]